jgi:hypothetical protein
MRYHSKNKMAKPCAARQSKPRDLNLAASAPTDVPCRFMAEAMYPACFALLDIVRVGELKMSERFRE